MQNNAYLAPRLGGPGASPLRRKLLEKDPLGRGDATPVQPAADGFHESVDGAHRLLEEDSAARDIAEKRIKGLGRNKFNKSISRKVAKLAKRSLGLANFAPLREVP